jgi:hypothetical protein
VVLRSMARLTLVLTSFLRFRCEGVRRYLLGLVMYGGMGVYMYVSG